MEGNVSPERIFRACYRRWAELGQPGRTRRGRRADTWDRPDEDYAADFELVSRRALVAPFERRVFELLFLVGMPETAIARRLTIEIDELRGLARRIERKLGIAFRDLRPYPLYPPGNYFRLGTGSGHSNDAREHLQPANSDGPIRARGGARGSQE